MKKLTSLFLALAFTVSSAATGLASVEPVNANTATSQIVRMTKNVTKRTYRGGKGVTKTVTRKTYRGGKYVTRKVVKGTRWTAHKTKRGFKRVFRRTKRVVQ